MNAQGTLTNGYDLEQRPGTTRILFVGSKATYDGKLLAAVGNTPGAETLEVWNGGIPAYGTVQHANFYKRDQSQIRPDRVVMVLAPNDIETTPIASLGPNNEVVAFAPYGPRGTLNPTLFQYSYLSRLLLGLTTRFSHGEQQLLLEIQDRLADLRAFLKKDHVDLVVVVMPLLLPEDMWTADQKERRRAILEILQNVGLRHIDLLPALGSSLSQQTNLHEHPGNPLEPSGDLARIVADYLRQQGLDLGSMMQSSAHSADHQRAA